VVKANLTRYKIRTRKHDEQPTVAVDSERLYALYVVEKMNLQKVGKELGINAVTVAKKLRKMGVEIRKAASYARKPRKVLITLPELSYDWLYKEYVGGNKSMESIAKNLHVSERVIRSRLDCHKIPIREKKKYLEVLTEDYLKAEYAVNKKSIKTIAVELNISAKAVSDYLEMHKITKRKPVGYGSNTISSEHRMYLIPLLEKYGLNHVTSYRIPRLPGQSKFANGYEIYE
jgi:DNA-binding CsgD family transcriptional regulator